MIQKIMAEQTYFEELFILQSWKGDSFTKPRQPSILKRLKAPSLPQKDMLFCFLTSLSMSHIVVTKATSSASHLLRPISDPSGKFLLLLAPSHCLHWKAAQINKLGVETLGSASWQKIGLVLDAVRPWVTPFCVRASVSQFENIWPLGPL